MGGKVGIGGIKGGVGRLSSIAIVVFTNILLPVPIFVQCFISKYMNTLPLKYCRLIPKGSGPLWTKWSLY